MKCIFCTIATAAMILLSSCSSEPRFKVGDCVITETYKGAVWWKIVRIGHYSYAITNINDHSINGQLLFSKEKLVYQTDCPK